jgi:hypothetical protein
MCAAITGLPAILDDGDNEQLIRGCRLKFKDKVWSAADGTPIHESDQFLVVGTGHVLQRWVGGLPEVITEMPLPDVDALNEAVPKSEWPIGKFSGLPEPPWRHVRYVYLVRVNDAAVLTHVNHTAGTRVAILRLKDRIKTMGVLRGDNVAPIVKLSWAMMPSAYGPRPRPDFGILEWRNLGGKQPAQVEHKQGEEPALPGKPVAVPTLSEEMGDEIPF